MIPWLDLNNINKTSGVPKKVPSFHNKKHWKNSSEKLRVFHVSPRRPACDDAIPEILGPHASINVRYVAAIFATKAVLGGLYLFAIWIHMICISPQQTLIFWNEAITIFLISGSKPTARNSLFCCFHLKTGRGLIHELCINCLWLGNYCTINPRCWYLLHTCLFLVYFCFWVGKWTNMTCKPMAKPLFVRSFWARDKGWPGKAIAQL